MKKYLSILFLGLVAISSCQENGQEELKDGLETMLKDQDPVAYENKLKELTLFMGEVFKDPDAIRELFDLAKADEYEEDISYSLKTLLETNQNPNTRQNSAIVSAFYKNAENHRIAQGEDFNEQDFIDFINENNISMLAPYMIGYFEPESITELTVSWWTEDNERKELEKNPNWEGETPGIKVKLDDDGNFIQFRKLQTNYFTNDLVYADDEYALDNPTIVFGSFDDDLILDTDETWMGGGVNPDSSLPNIVNNSRCEDLTSNSIVRLTMPKFRLTSSIRNWPHHDRMSVVVVLGTNPGGSAYANRPFFEETVTRGRAKDQDWLISPASFLVNNWQDRQVDLAFVVFYRKRHGKESYEAVVTVKTDSDGNFNSTITQTLKVGGWSRSRLHGDATFNRCGTIVDPFRDKGFGLEGHSGTNYGIERINKFEFILVPEISL